MCLHAHTHTHTHTHRHTRTYVQVTQSRLNQQVQVCVCLYECLSVCLAACLQACMHAHRYVHGDVCADRWMDLGKPRAVYRVLFTTSHRISFVVYASVLCTHVYTRQSDIPWVLFLFYFIQCNLQAPMYCFRPIACYQFISRSKHSCLAWKLWFRIMSKASQACLSGRLACFCVLAMRPNQHCLQHLSERQCQTLQESQAANSVPQTPKL